MFGFLKEKLSGWIKKVSPEKLPKTEKSTKNQRKKKKEKNQQEIGNKISKEIEKEQRKTRKRAKKQYELEEIKEEINKEKGFFSNLFNKKEEKSEISTSFFDRFKSKVDEENFEELFSELELILLQNNVALIAVEEIKEKLKEELIGKILKEVDITKTLKKALENLLINPPDLTNYIKEKLNTKKPFVIIFIGINGSGKTTTIAKLANKLKKEGFSLCLAAGDTFRAASIEQLEQHAKKLDIPLIKKDYGSDPASVGFDAIAYAKKHNKDIVLIDTAGRMNTKDSLLKEMEKIVKVCNPDLKLFIGESITGNDATEQAKKFHESIGLDGAILSKADVDEKGGVAISISKVIGKPIFFLGTGQEYKDLEIFDKEKVLEKIGLI